MQGELLADGSKRITLSRGQYVRIEQILRSFYQRTKCGAVVLADVSGMQVAQAGTMDRGASALLGTLAAGNYAATNEMAKLLGEEAGFKVTFLEGSKRNLFVAGVDESFLVVIVFGEPTTFGMVRVLTTKMTEELREALVAKADGDGVVEIVSAAVQSQDFQEELSSKLDSVLFGRH